AGIGRGLPSLIERNRTKIPCRLRPCYRFHWPRQPLSDRQARSRGIPSRTPVGPPRRVVPRDGSPKQSSRTPHPRKPQSHPGRRSPPNHCARLQRLVLLSLINVSRENGWVHKSCETVGDWNTRCPVGE